MKPFLDIPPMLCARGTVRLPGSKSISNRVLLLAALSEGKTEVRDLLHSDDTGRMLDGLRTLGVAIEALGGNSYRVTGCGGNFQNKDAELFLGNAGTAFRPLTAALAFSGGHYVLKGVPRMHERPIGDLVDALRGLGADIRYLGKEGFPPLEIFPAKPAGDSVRVRGDVSSQFLTGLLMALPLLRRNVTVEVAGELISKPYIEITLAMMARFGVKVERQDWRRFAVPGERYQSPDVVYVEGDASSASYFLAAGAIGGGPVRVEGVGADSIQGDVLFAQALEKMGAVIRRGPNWMESSAPEKGRLQGIDLDCNHIPDAAMTLAVAALFAEGPTRLSNIANWRVKETDRIAAMACELRKVGATVEEGEDFIRIVPPERIKRAAIDTYDDHRMAMCFSLAAFGEEGIRINDPRCVDKTFPDYFERFFEIADAIPVIAIDGPSASGKGTVAALAAEKLGFHYLDSGALYRIAALHATKTGLSFTEEDKLSRQLASVRIEFSGQKVLLDGEDASEEIRSEECSRGASLVAALPKVRQALFDLQRQFKQKPGLVADGRDMGSTVFPEAFLKIFLTASAEERANRRHKQLKAKGIDVKLEDVLRDIRERDERDSRRSVAPLQKNADAELLDTTHIGIADAVSDVLKKYDMKRRRNRPAD